MKKKLTVNGLLALILSKTDRIVQNICNPELHRIRKLSAIGMVMASMGGKTGKKIKGNKK
jgi:hypothetical protein